MRFVTALLGLILALASSPLAAEDCTISLLGKKAGYAPEATDTSATTGIAVPMSGVLTIAVTQADSQCVATDPNGMDGSAAISIPEGDYTVIARALGGGKKAGSFTIGETTLARGKGKPKWQEVALSGGSWSVTLGGQHLQLRVLSQVSEDEPK